MNKEECERALETLTQYVYTASQETVNANDCYEINVFRQLINEHFELVEELDLIESYSANELADWSR